MNHGSKEIPYLHYDQQHKTSFPDIAGVSDRMDNVLQKYEFNIGYACDRLAVESSGIFNSIVSFK